LLINVTLLLTNVKY